MLAGTSLKMCVGAGFEKGSDFSLRLVSYSHRVMEHTHEYWRLNLKYITSFLKIKIVSRGYKVLNFLPLKSFWSSTSALSPNEIKKLEQLSHVSSSSSSLKFGRGKFQGLKRIGIFFPWARFFFNLHWVTAAKIWADQAFTLCLIFTILVSFSRENALLASKAKINIVWNFFEWSGFKRDQNYENHT